MSDTSARASRFAFALGSLARNGLIGGRAGADVAGAPPAADCTVPGAAPVVPAPAGAGLDGGRMNGIPGRDAGVGIDTGAAGGGIIDGSEGGIAGGTAGGIAGGRAGVAGAGVERGAI